MMNNRQKLLQIAEDLGEPRRSIVLTCVAELNDLHKRKAEMFAELEQVKRFANDQAATVEQLESIAYRFLENVEEVTELLEASGDADNIKLLVAELNDIATSVESLPTPNRYLSERDAEVARVAFLEGAEWARRPKPIDATVTIKSAANDYAKGIKAGD